MTGPLTGKLGVDRIVEPERCGAVLAGLLGEIFLKEKFLYVPGAGRTGRAKGTPFFFGPGINPQKVGGVGVGVAGHVKSVYVLIGIKKAFVSSDNRSSL
jgi:hypothetical protein